MTARSTYLILAASVALAPALLAQDHAVPRGGGSSSGGGGGSHPSPGVSSSSGGSSSGSGSSGGSSSGSGSYAPSTAERRHPRAGTGRGSGGGYYPGYPGYPGGGYYPGWGGGWYYPGYAWGSWWPYGSFGWYGGYYGYPWGWGGGGGTVYHTVEREGGSLRVLVDPSEARVYVDGYYAGTVDDFDGLFQRLNVGPGRHEIALKLEGFKTHRMKVYVTPETTTKLHYDMERGQGETLEDLTRDVPEGETPRERGGEDRWSESEDRPARNGVAVGGRLRLTVRPDDASVYVDGAFRGSAREASELQLAPGRHRIEVVRPGYRTVDREVDVAPNDTTDLSVELERPVV
jgi:hypothetical protein